MYVESARLKCWPSTVEISIWVVLLLSMIGRLGVLSGREAQIGWSFFNYISHSATDSLGPRGELSRPFIVGNRRSASAWCMTVCFVCPIVEGPPYCTSSSLLLFTFPHFLHAGRQSPPQLFLMEPHSRTHACHACRRRKIRCNRAQPCAYCVKNQLPCDYPLAIRSTVRSSGASGSSRVGELEAVITGLQQQITSSTNSASQGSASISNVGSSNIPQVDTAEIVSSSLPPDGSPLSRTSIQRSEFSQGHRGVTTARPGLT